MAESGNTTLPQGNGSASPELVSLVPVAAAAAAAAEEEPAQPPSRQESLQEMDGQHRCSVTTSFEREDGKAPTVARLVLEWPKDEERKRDQVSRFFEELLRRDEPGLFQAARRGSQR